MSRETAIVKRAMSAIPDCPGLSVGPYEPEPGRHRGDARSDGLLTVRYRGAKRTYSVEAKGSFRSETLRHMVAAGGPARGLEPPMLAADHMNPAQAALLRDAGVPFIDSAGNAFLAVGDLYLFVSGRKAKRNSAAARGGRLTARNGLKLVYALLVADGRGDGGPPLIGRTFREIASAADVSLGSVSPVVAELRERDHLVEGLDGMRRLVDCPRLAETWVTAFADRLRPKLLRRRYRAGGVRDWAAAGLPGGDVLWGGEVAAAKMTGHLKPQVVTLYAGREVNDLVLEWDLRVDEGGDVEVLDFFWGNLPGAGRGDCVHPLLAYADLLASGEDRNIETSRRLYGALLRQHLEAD